MIRAFLLIALLLGSATAAQAQNAPPVTACHGAFPLGSIPAETRGVEYGNCLVPTQSGSASPLTATRSAR